MVDATKPAADVSPRDWLNFKGREWIKDDEAVSQVMVAADAYAKSERAAGQRAAVERLRPWLTHKDGLHVDDTDCQCGLDAALEELNGAVP